MSSYYTAEAIHIADKHELMCCTGCQQLRPLYNYTWTWMFDNEFNIRHFIACEGCVIRENISVIRDTNPVYSSKMYGDDTIIIIYSAFRLYQICVEDADIGPVKL